MAYSLAAVSHALGGYDALSAIPVFANVAIAAAGGFDRSNSVASALGDYDALSAVDTFFGDGPTGQGGVFTGGGIDALAPDADGNGGYAALSALPVFFGDSQAVRSVRVCSPVAVSARCPITTR